MNSEGNWVRILEDLVRCVEPTNHSSCLRQGDDWICLDIFWIMLYRLISNLYHLIPMGCESPSTQHLRPNLLNRIGSQRASCHPSHPESLGHRGTGLVSPSCSTKLLIKTSDCPSLCLKLDKQIGNWDACLQDPHLALSHNSSRSRLSSFEYTNKSDLQLVHDMQSLEDVTILLELRSEY